MSLLGLQQRDMHGGMKAFSKLTKERVVSVERMSSAMQLPGGKDSRLLRHLFQAASSSSTDRSCQGMTFRTFMFFHALLRQAQRRKDQILVHCHETQRQCILWNT